MFYCDVKCALNGELRRGSRMLYELYKAYNIHRKLKEGLYICKKARVSLPKESFYELVFMFLKACC